MRVFLDATVHLFAYQSAQTNSSLVLDAMDGVLFQAVVSYKTLAEVQRRARELYGKDVAGLMRRNVLLLPGLTVVTEDQVTPLLARYESFVADRADLPHICAYFSAGCQVFVTSDDRLVEMAISKLANFQSPYQFVSETLRATPYNTPRGI